MTSNASLSQATRAHKAAHRALSAVLTDVAEDDPELYDLIMQERETARAVEVAHRLRYRLLRTGKPYIEED
jgi:hypothetical protein